MEDFNVWVFISTALAGIATFFGGFWKKLSGFVNRVRTEVIPQVRELLTESYDVVEASEKLAKESLDVAELVLSSLEDGTWVKNKEKLRIEVEQMKLAYEDLKVQVAEAKQEFEETVELYF